MRYDQAFLHPSETETPEPGPLLPNAYDSEGFSIQNGFLTYQGDAPCYIGVDVSSHQKEIDWARVAASGVQFAMIRVGYRGYSVGSINKDAYFDQNIQGALDNGLAVGVYFFSQATSVEEAEEEALQTLAWIEGYDITYPVVFDWEQVDQDSSRTKDAEGKTTTECDLRRRPSAGGADPVPLLAGPLHPGLGPQQLPLPLSYVAVLQLGRGGRH